MTRRLLLSYLTVTAVVLVLLELPLAVFFAQRERERLTADVERDARVMATFYEDALEKDGPVDTSLAMNYEQRTGGRVVVVDDHGISVVDTEEPTNRDFSTRPEIAIALTGAGSSGTRRSETLNTDLLYVAVPVASSGVVHGALRVTLSTSEVDRRIHRFWWGLAVIAAVVLAMMALVGWTIARSVTRPLRRLNATAARFASGDLVVADHPAEGPPEIRALDHRMATMAVRLAALIDEQKAFAADASHQLRTPLTGLRLRLENLQSRLAETDSADLDAAIDETDRLARLVGDLLQLARAEQPAASVDADLARLTADRVDTWTAAADQKGVRLELRGTASPVMVRAVPGAIEQILDNVLDNAIIAAPTGTPVTVSVARGSGTHELSIADRGRGLSDADKARATRRFWRGDPSVPGTGLGLAIADTLATASSGSLRLTDTPGGGLTVTLVLLAAGVGGQRSS